MTPPQHTFFFSRKTLCAILENMGYEIAVAKRPWKWVPLGLIFFQLGNRLGYSIKWLDKLSGISIPVNLFDTVMIVARKKQKQAFVHPSWLAAAERISCFRGSK